ncbi:uncharacterized protein LOC119903843 [Micropterus salmoides]|uniref:uncharacterized protein LOC119903843 n=1 Tax=Micropterus salmoides TaxID=27706 RepID=UPI0018ECF41B|nr:uncharacterized protein LOC119903843 [Micropterus salmoides]
MFRLNQATLIFFQVLVTCQVFAGTGIHQVDYRDVLVSRGASIMFTCNTYNENATQITWTKGRTFFVYSVVHNLTFSNLTSHRLRIDLNLPSKLDIFNAQHDDAGLYTCHVVDTDGPKTIEWNLTVSNKPEDISPSRWYFLYILTSVIGLLLCGFTSAVCFCRKSWTKTPNQDLANSRTLSNVQYHAQLGGESLQVAPPPLQSCAEYRMNHKNREIRCVPDISENDENVQPPTRKSTMER